MSLLRVWVAACVYGARSYLRILIIELMSIFFRNGIQYGHCLRYDFRAYSVAREDCYVLFHIMDHISIEHRYTGRRHLLIVFVGDDVIHTGQKIIDVCVAVHKALLLVAHYRKSFRADSFSSYGLRRKVDKDFK